MDRVVTVRIDTYRKTFGRVPESRAAGTWIFGRKENGRFKCVAMTGLFLECCCQARLWAKRRGYKVVTLMPVEQR